MKIADDGSRLIAHTPRDYPHAYLHSFFAPAPDSAWERYDLMVPAHLQQLYRECNGLSIFTDSLSLWGLREHHERDMSAQFQPFDLATHHSECVNSFHPRALPGHKNRVFFAGYGEDGSSVFSIPTGPQVFRVLRGSSEVVDSWSDLTAFLTTEYDRIDRLFSRSGYPIDEDMPTTPPKAA